MKLPSTLDLILWGLVALGGLGLLFVIKGWHDDSTVKLPQALAAAERLEVTLESERAARAHELKIAKDASDAYQAELARVRAAPDLGVVRLCPSAKRVPATPAQGTATGRPDAAGPGHVEVPDAPDIEGRDIGPDLSDFVEDCEANAAQLQSLQDWVRAR